MKSTLLGGLAVQGLSLGMTELERAMLEGKEAAFQRVIFNLFREGESVALIARVVGKKEPEVVQVLQQLGVELAGPP